MIKIAGIEKNSTAEKAGLLPGDKILKINGEEVRDRLDFEFMRGEEELKLEFMRQNEIQETILHREYGSQLGIEPEIMKIHICKNNCVFCFVYQNPKGMRKSMYVKDEDYRYSFLDGHFTTLSNMKPEDWDRVLEQNLSPIYVSVQATDPEVRARLLDNYKLEPIMERLEWLKKNEIDFHTQLVIIPGWNDGEVLEKSLNDLMGLYPNLQSISVVPIGLTGYREKLPDLKTFTKKDAENCLELVNRYIQKCTDEFEENFIFASDEIYVVSESELPNPEFYGDYSQYENGVGTLTSLLDDFKRELPDLPTAPDNWEITVLTGKIAGGYKKKIMEELLEKRNLKSEVIECENITFGKSVTVTGLLCGKDFEAALEKSEFTGPVLIPPNSLNSQGSFLDDMSPEDLQNKFNRQVIVPNSFQNYFPQT